jgi:hypothetical protein
MTTFANIMEELGKLSPSKYVRNLFIIRFGILSRICPWVNTAVDI